MTTKTDTQAAYEKWLGARADDPSLPHGLMRDAFCAGVEAGRADHFRGVTKMAPIGEAAQGACRVLPEDVPATLVQDLRSAVEGECDGLDITETQARMILGFLLSRYSGQPAASAEPCFCDRMYPDSNPAATCGDCPRDYRPAASAEPSGYAYRYPDGIRFNDGREVNGCKPTETLPYWFGAAPVAQEQSESVALLDALSGLVKALRERHYGRMPDEVQAAYDKAWAIVFSSPVAAPVAAQAPAVAWMDDGSTTRGPGKPAYRVVTAATKAEMPAIVAAAYSTPLGVIGAAQPCDHVYEARPIDGSRSAAAPSEAVCRKCGARGDASLTPDMQRDEKRGAESGQDHDTALADTQRAIIEAAERRGYARADAENVGYRTDAGRYRFIRPGDKDVWCSSGDDLLTGDRLDAAIDAARAAKGADHA